MKTGKVGQRDDWLLHPSGYFAAVAGLAFGPDGEVLLPSSVNMVCYKPIQPIQHRVS